MPISSSGAEARIASTIRATIRDAAQPASRRPARRLRDGGEELREQVAVRGVQLDHLESRLPGIDAPRRGIPRSPRRSRRRSGRARGSAPAASERPTGRPARTTSPRRSSRDRGARAGRPATAPSERIASRAERHPRDGLLAPRLAHDPSPPRRLGRRHRAADDQHRGAAGRATPPVLGIGGLCQTVRDESGAVRGSDEPVAQDEPVAEPRTARPRAGPRRSSAQSVGSAASDEREVAGRRRASPRPRGARARASRSSSRRPRAGARCGSGRPAPSRSRARPRTAGERCGRRVPCASSPSTSTW